MTTETVEVVCPHCHDTAKVVAMPYNINYLEFDTTYDRKADLVFIDWDSYDIEANYSYHCELCGFKLGDTTDDIKKLYKDQKQEDYSKMK